MADEREDWVEAAEVLWKMYSDDTLRLTPTELRSLAVAVGALCRRADPPQPKDQEVCDVCGRPLDDYFHAKNPDPHGGGSGPDMGSAPASAPEVGPTEEEWELAEEALDWIEEIEEEEREASAPEGEPREVQPSHATGRVSPEDADEAVRKVRERRAEEGGDG